MSSCCIACYRVAIPESTTDLYLTVTVTVPTYHALTHPQLTKQWLVDFCIILFFPLIFYARWKSSILSIALLKETNCRKSRLTSSWPTNDRKGNVNCRWKRLLIVDHRLPIFNRSFLGIREFLEIALFCCRIYYYYNYYYYIHVLF